MNRNDLHWWLTLIRRGLYFTGLFLGLVALAELARIGQFFFSIHAWLGYAWSLALLLAAAWGGRAGWRFFRSKPRRLADLPRVDLLDANDEDRLVYARVLPLHLERMLDSPVLAVEEVSEARRQLPATPEGWTGLGRDELLELELRVLAPLQERLDKEAESEIRGATLEVTTAVALSPWRSFDSLMVIARGLRMIFRISEIYGSRPTLREQLEIMRDIGKAVASVGLIGAGQKLMENMASHLPLAGRVVDDMLQGIGAGFYINLAGWAARERCRALHRWEPERVREKLRNQIRRYARDMRKRLTVDLGPAIWDRLTRRFRGSQETDLKAAFAHAAEEVERDWDAEPTPETGSLGDTLRSIWRSITPQRHS